MIAASSRRACSSVIWAFLSGAVSGLQIRGGVSPELQGAEGPQKSGVAHGVLRPKGARESVGR